jgi:hypothetical protein
MYRDDGQDKRKGRPFSPDPSAEYKRREEKKFYNQNIFNQSQRAYKNSRRGEPSDNPSRHTPANLENLGEKKKRKTSGKNEYFKKRSFAPFRLWISVGLWGVGESLQYRSNSPFSLLDI